MADLDRHSQYEHPLAARYADKALSAIWSNANKFATWRKLWVVLAKAEMELGVADITPAIIDEMSAAVHDIDFARAEEKEKELRHDVMAHVHTFGECCPNAKKIIHLGATSCFVTDNTELLQIRDSLVFVRNKLLAVIQLLAAFADKYKDLPTLGFTHFQPAQLTTVGKRACLWLQDFTLDLESIETLLERLPFRGAKGTTGTQASFLELFEGDHSKVKELDRRVTAAMGFSRSLPITGQTYTRKIDFQVMSALSGVAQSAAKMATDLRLLAHLKEIEEPFGKQQIGSSAMAYKRNPMRSERICSLARYVMSLTENAAQTHANQWLERTLDDSANRRLVLPEAFLGADACLSIAANVVDGLQVWPFVIRKHIDAELPFMATEVTLMACVKAGGDRQHLHECIRTHSMAAARRVKEGADNDLMARIAGDAAFAAVHAQLATLTDPCAFVGRAPQQVGEFLAGEVAAALAPYAHVLAGAAATAELSV